MMTQHRTRAQQAENLACILHGQDMAVNRATAERYIAEAEDRATAALRAENERLREALAQRDQELSTLLDQAKDTGATETINLLADFLDVADWVGCDGSETWEGDVQGTLINVLKAAKIYDAEDGKLAMLPHTSSGRTDRDRLDWLAKQKFAELRCFDDGWCVAIDSVLQAESHPSPQAAIDAAVDREGRGDGA